MLNIQKFGLFSIDVFASSTNTKCSNFFSFYNKYLTFQDLYKIEQYLQKQMPSNHIATLQYIHFKFQYDEEEYIKFVQISHHLNATPVVEQSLMYERVQIKVVEGQTPPYVSKTMKLPFGRVSDVYFCVESPGETSTFCKDDILIEIISNGQVINLLRVESVEERHLLYKTHGKGRPVTFTIMRKRENSGDNIINMTHHRRIKELSTTGKPPPPPPPPPAAAAGAGASTAGDIKRKYQHPRWNY